MITASPPSRHPASSRWQARDGRRPFRAPEALIEALGLDAALIAPARAGGREIPPPRAARLCGAHAPGRPERPAAAAGAAHRRRSASRRRLHGPTRSASARRAARPACCRNIRAARCSSRPRPAPFTAATASGASSRTPSRRATPRASAKRWTEIARDPSLEEIILSGGDPLSLERCAPHRAHGRAREDSSCQAPAPPHAPADRAALARGCRAHRLAAAPALARGLRAPRQPRRTKSTRTCAPPARSLRAAGVTLLNQTVLLKGVNDDADALADLSRALFEAGVLPYYLHVLDRVSGAAHFDRARARAQEIAGDLAARLPGYLVPRLVREVEGAPAKLTSAAAIHRKVSGAACSSTRGEG